LLGRARSCQTTWTNTSPSAAKKGAKDPTIQRELSLLQKMLNHSDVRDLPKFPRLSESLPRQGFVEDAQFEQLRDHILDGGVRGMASLAFRYGFRKEELQNLLCRQVNFTERSLHLYQGTTKNSQPRKVVLDSECLEDLKEVAKGKGPDDYMFTWTTGNKKGSGFGTSGNAGIWPAKPPSCRDFCSMTFAAVRFAGWFAAE
jgi:integrase